MDIEEEFLEKCKKNNAKKAFAYIDRKYGWTYKVNNRFTFDGLCALVENYTYKEYSLRSLYSHGTSLYLKTNDSVSMQDIIDMIRPIHKKLKNLINTYCKEKAEGEFFAISNEVEKCIDTFKTESD